MVVHKHALSFQDPCARQESLDDEVHRGQPPAREDGKLIWELE